MGTARGWRERLAVAVPPLLLLGAAVTQMVMARTLSLSPWKGGGFGMFASVDGLPFRTVRIEVSGLNRSEQMDVPPSLSDLADAAATFPTRRSLEHLAQGVIGRERRYGREVDRVRVEVWRADYSAALDSNWTLISGLSVGVDDHATEAIRRLP